MSIEPIRTKSIYPINQDIMVLSSSDEHDLISSTMNEDSHAPLSETVTTLASKVYKELERIIKNFGENSVKDLMPVMISTLESLDGALHEREVNKFEIESLKEQTEQLYQQYEREKSFHKEYQQRYLQIEDHLEEIKRENDEKLRSLDSIVKIFEIKARNASDHVGRLEDKENEMKQEYKRLHDRYCELFKVHCDYMERTKILYGTDRLDQLTTLTHTSSQSRGNLQLSSTSQSLADKQTDKMPPTNPDTTLQCSQEQEVDFRPEIDVVDVKHTQTECMASNDAAVNTAKLAKLTQMDEVCPREFSSEHDNTYLEKYKRGIFTKLRNLNLLSQPFDEQQFFVTEDEFEHSNNITDITISDDDDDDISVDESKNLEAFDKETRNDNIDISDVDASADLFVRQSFYGMTKEVSNLIKENNELLETKNALNVLKDDLLVKIEELSNDLEIAREEAESLQTVRSRLQSRVNDVEEELRKIREELEKKKEAEENVPTEDRKRFTRVEMQRVLLERNQYKQRLFELEEAIHRHDALRASRREQLYSTSSISTTHDNLFDQIHNKNKPKFMKLKGTQTAIHDQQTAQEDSSSIPKESPPMTSSTPKEITPLTSSTSKSLWRVLSEDWLPTSIVPTNILGVPVVDIQSDLREGTTQISDFFSGLFGTTGKETSPKRSISSTTTTNLSSSAETSMKQNSPKHQTASATTTSNNESNVVPLEKSSAPSRNDNSNLTDEANRFQAYGWTLPSKDYLKSSTINGKIQMNVPVPTFCQPIFSSNDKTQIWCAAGIDLSGLSLNVNETSVDQLNKQLIESYHQMIDEQYLKLSSLVWIAAHVNDTAMITIIDSNKPDKIIDTFTLGNAIIYAMGSVPGTSNADYAPLDDPKLNETTSTSDVKIISCTATSLSTGGGRSNSTETSESIHYDTSHQTVDGVKTKYPTVWLGSSDGWLYIYSALGDHRTMIGKVWLRHAIYSIVHVRGRVFVSLANEKLIVFHRNTDGTWNLNNLHVITTGKSRESIRCTVNVKESIWCGVANRVYIIDSQTLEIRKQVEVHPRPEHSVQHMTCSGDGVWLSIRLSSSLKLYHAQSYQHLQDVDIQPYIEKMIVTEKTGLYFVHITALAIVCRRLWVGTGTGIIISVPLIDSITTTSSSTSIRPGSIVRVHDQISPSNYIPYCSMNNAQLSFHGYKDAVKFFVAVPALQEETISESSTDISSFGDIFVVSGGDGYIDFRVGNTSATDNNRHVSYLTIWHSGSA
ncbi:unnamed protein product [Rotaria magnacalcarata]|uniref:Uncharacterized protein n=1 Tax=Rotaria magnacalcarata TaxID=392030 RepID=A0A816X5F4_9BILA|nr:unnamed protein product [Rotaria magnacalcarata]